MADAPTNGHSEWRPEDFEELHRAIGMLGPQEIAIIPGKPPITLDLSGVGVLTAMGKWNNPVMLAAGDAFDAAAQRLHTAVETAAGADPTAPMSAAQTTALNETVQRSLEWYDCVLRAVVLRPPYQDLGSLKREGPRPGHLTVLSFTAEQRQAVQALINGGAEALARFRADPAGFIAGFALQGLQAEPGGGADPPGAVASEAVAERSDLAPRGRVGSGAARRRERAALAAAAQGAPADAEAGPP